MADLDWVRVTDKDTGISRTVREVELNHGNYELLNEPAIDPISGDPRPDSYPEHPPASGYAAESNAELEKQIKARNADRDDARQIKPAGKKKDALVAALEADDAATATAASPQTDPQNGTGDPAGVSEEN